MMVDIIFDDILIRLSTNKLDILDHNLSTSTVIASLLQTFRINCACGLYTCRTHI